MKSQRVLRLLDKIDIDSDNLRLFLEQVKDLLETP
jgi:hypothetical protein